MKTLAKTKPEVGIWMVDAPEPEVGHNDVLIKIHKTAICGTDVHIYNWDHWAQETISVPMTVGHEFMGEVVDLGIEVRGIEIGQRVSGEGHITCGHCRNCRAGKRHLCRNTVGVGVNRAGCFAEYLSIPAVNVFKLPDDVSSDIASILDPFGNAAHTALAFDLVGEDVLITGAGPIGIMAVATGGTIDRIVVTQAQGGVCYCSGGNAFLTLSAGYLGSLGWGALILTAARTKLPGPRNVTTFIGVAVLLLTALYVRNGFGILFGALFGAALIALRATGRMVHVLTLTGLGLTSCLYALLDIKSDVLDRPYLNSDARMLAEMTGLPTVVWGVLWIGLGLAVSVWLFRRALEKA